MKQEYTQKHFSLDEEKLKRFKIAVASSPQDYLLIAFGVSSKRGGLPVFWDVVYRKDNGWVVDIMDTNFQRSYHQHTPCQVALVITDDNNLIHYPLSKEIIN